MVSAAHKPDYVLIGTTAILLLYGLVALSSASAVLSQEHFDTTGYYLRHQLLYGLGGGVLIFLVAQAIPYTFWQRIALALLLVTIFALTIVFAPGVSYSYGGATRWIKAGGFSFQPSELVKLAFLLYLAAWLGARKAHIERFSYSFMPFAIMLGLIALLLVLQPDIGTLGVIVVMALSQYYIAGGTIRHLGIGVLAGLVILGGLIYLQPYRINRIKAFINPNEDPLGKSYQINQAMLAIGSGGVWGRGLGHGIQKYHYLPEAMGDSIFASIGEEFGFVGTTALVLLLFIWAYRAISISARAPDTFGKLVAAGIAAWVFWQAFINMGAMTGILPLTGIPLPFISYGGTSLLALAAASGILVNISKHA